MSSELSPVLRVVDAPEQGRYEARLDDQIAGVAYYTRRGDLTIFTHTEVDPAFEGQGVGSALARHALDDVRAQGGRVVPRCPFFATYLRRHTEFGDLVVTQTSAGPGATTSDAGER